MTIPPLQVQSENLLCERCVEYHLVAGLRSEATKFVSTNGIRRIWHGTVSYTVFSVILCGDDHHRGSIWGGMALEVPSRNREVRPVILCVGGSTTSRCLPQNRTLRVLHAD